MKELQLYKFHYNDVIMTTIVSQITSLAVVYSTVYSDVDQRKHQSSASLAFVWGFHRDRWIPRTEGQLRVKCFHMMTSSWRKWHYCLYNGPPKILEDAFILKPVIIFDATVCETVVSGGHYHKGVWAIKSKRLLKLKCRIKITHFIKKIWK